MCCIFVCVHGVAVFAIECRVSVMDGESVFLKDPDGGVGRNIREFHLLAIIVKNLIQGLKPDGGDSYVHHFHEWAGLAEV